jgi:hypothetical protein
MKPLMASCDVTGRFISGGPSIDEHLPLSNYVSTCHSSGVKFGLAPPPCVNYGPPTGPFSVQI